MCVYNPTELPFCMPPLVVGYELPESTLSVRIHDSGGKTKFKTVVCLGFANVKCKRKVFLVSTPVNSKKGSSVGSEHLNGPDGACVQVQLFPLFLFGVCVSFLFLWEKRLLFKPPLAFSSFFWPFGLSWLVSISLVFLLLMTNLTSHKEETAFEVRYLWGHDEDCLRNYPPPDGTFKLTSVTNLRKKLVTFMLYSNDMLHHGTCLKLNLLRS